jgi:phosphoethanolamine N-methyltransferase
MMLNTDALKFSELEKLEIIGYLPSTAGKQVLELGAGIGRFTGHLASIANHVIAVDFVEKFIQANQEINANFSNITYHVQNVMDINFAQNSFDFIYNNWLFTCLEDHECSLLVELISQWLKPKGQIFVRESCFGPSIPNIPCSTSRYRTSKFYIDLFTSNFTRIASGNIAIYEQKYNNPNQLWWLFQKK